MRVFSPEHIQKLRLARRFQKVDPEVYKRMSAKTRGKINIKKYLAIAPDGSQYVTTRGLKIFCAERDLDESNMVHTATGRRKHHKGWRLFPYKEDKNGKK